VDIAAERVVRRRTVDRVGATGDGAAAAFSDALPLLVAAAAPWIRSSDAGRGSDAAAVVADGAAATSAVQAYWASLREHRGLAEVRAAIELLARRRETAAARAADGEAAAVLYETQAANLAQRLQQQAAAIVQLERDAQAAKLKASAFAALAAKSAVMVRKPTSSSDGAGGVGGGRAPR